MVRRQKRPIKREHKDVHIGERGTQPITFERSRGDMYITNTQVK